MNPPLYGNQAENDRWVEYYWICPCCARIRHDKEARQAQQDLAAMIADNIVKRLKESNL